MNVQQSVKFGPCILKINSHERQYHVTSSEKVHIYSYRKGREDKYEVWKDPKTSPGYTKMFHPLTFKLEHFLAPCPLPPENAAQQYDYSKDRAFQAHRVSAASKIAAATYREREKFIILTPGLLAMFVCD